MVVYADVLFLVNFISCYIMIQILAKTVFVVKISKIRAAAASLLGGAGAVAVFCIPFGKASGAAVRILSVFFMIFTAFYEQRKRFSEQIVYFALLSGMTVFAMIFVASAAVRTLNVTVKSGILYFDLPPKIFLPSLGASYFIMLFFVKAFKNRKNKRYYIVSVTHNDRTVTVTALFDSGNLLREPFTGKYVSIMEWESVKEFFGADYDYSQIENHAEDMKLWAVPFNSVGNQSGIIFAFLADSLFIREEKKTIKKAMIGICGNALSKDGKYRALINAGLL